MEEDYILKQIKDDLTRPKNETSQEKVPENLKPIIRAELLRCAEAKKEARRLKEEGDCDGAKKVLNLQLANMSKLVQMVDDDELAEEVRELGNNIFHLNEASFDRTSRKQISYNAYKQKHGRKGNG
jgi:Ca-activated chloride channel family protein